LDETKALNFLRPVRASTTVPASDSWEESQFLVVPYRPRWNPDFLANLRDRM